MRLQTARLILALPGPAAGARAVAYYVDNRAHLDPWEPPRPDGFYTEGHHAEKLGRDLRDLDDGKGARFLIFGRDEGISGPVLGLVNFSQVVRGPLQSCFLGYSLAERATGKGLITEALRAAIPFAWDTLRLHRIQASYVPTNERSARVLRRLGFSVEGYARDYLWVGGAWRDHIMTALLNPDYRPPWG